MLISIENYAFKIVENSENSGPHFLMEYYAANFLCSIFFRLNISFNVNDFDECVHISLQAINDWVKWL